MMTERDRRVVRLADELVRRHSLTLPVAVERICPLYGARLLPLSELTARGMDAETVFACWGNRDGVAMQSRSVRTIAYNDRTAVNRIRFTLAEELMHLLLGHASDGRFSVARQLYDEETYALYEAEAKHGAAMLLLPPTVYFRYRERLSLASIAQLCQISRACAWTAAQYYEQNETELRALFTASPVARDLCALARKRPLRPIAVFPAPERYS